MNIKKKNGWDGLIAVPAFNAKRLAKIHDRVNDWVAAAPVLALLPDLKPINDSLRRMACGGFRLKTVFAELGIPTYARHIQSTGVNHLYENNVGYSGICMLTNRDIDLVDGKIAIWRAVAIARASVYHFGGDRDAVRWLLKYHGAAEGMDLSGIAEFFEEVGPHWDWSPSRIREEAERHAREKRYREILETANNPENTVPIDLAGSPEEIVLNGVTCRALTTRGALIVEGFEMNHCVGGYGESLMNGSCLYYSLTSREGRSTAQFSYNKKGGIYLREQNARHNNTPDPHHIHAAEQLISHLKMPRADEAREEYERERERERDQACLPGEATLASLAEVTQRRYMEELLRIHLAERRLPPDVFRAEMQHFEYRQAMQARAQAERQFLRGFRPIPVARPEYRIGDVVRTEEIDEVLDED